MRKKRKNELRKIKRKDTIINDAKNAFKDN